jgi:NADH:ubiquinone reductase (H+-translocating)
MASLPHVVIIGGGFGGLNAAKALGRAPVAVTVIDRSNHHLFQPLLYQVATAGLSPADIAVPIRSVLSRQANAETLMGEVVGVDRAAKRVRLASGREVAYDFLVVASGASHSYFGHEDWARFAPGLKTVVDAIEIRRRVLLAFEGAETETDAEKAREWLTFVVVGGGPTGVEVAGSIGELARFALARDFRHIDPASARVILVEAGPRVLASFPPELSERSVRMLAKLGVEVRAGQRVEQVDAEGVMASGRRIKARTVVWAAGVVASQASRWLGAEADRAGRVKVGSDLTLPGHPEIFVIGDTASVSQDGKPLPGVAPVAMQEGRFVGRQIARAVSRGEREAAFRYVDKGNLATIGRRYAVADIHGLKLSGFVGWIVWVAVHIYYLIGFRNRLLVLLEWAWAYVTYGRGARIITDRPTE